MRTRARPTSRDELSSQTSKTRKASTKKTIAHSTNDVQADGATTFMGKEKEEKIWSDDKECKKKNVHHQN